jgi:hypothetical protein
MRSALLIAIAPFAVSAVITPRARAAEQVTLANGFAMRCDHHAQVQGRVRLYLSHGEDNYIEFAPAEVATFETVPDQPSPDPPAPDPQAQASPAAAAATTSPAHLTPADLHEMLTQAGAVHNIDVDLLASVVKAESGGNTRAVSRAGAQGLMQLMPDTASSLGVKDSFEPGQNVRGGSAYLDSLLTRYHENLAFALAAYNAGPAAVDKYHGIPPYNETRAYVARVIHEFNRRVLAREAAAQSAPAPQSATK